jgi:iron complex outermembrane receptor protein
VRSALFVMSEIAAISLDSQSGQRRNLSLRSGYLLLKKTLYSSMKPSRQQPTVINSLVRGGGVFMRLSVAAAAICLSIVGFCVAGESHASIKRPTNIPAQGLGPALQTLAKDRGFQVVYESDQINSLRTQGASGDLTSEEALTQLLSGTGLTYRFFDDDAVSILPVKSPRPAPGSQTTTAAPGADNGKEVKRSSSDSFRLAQTTQGSSGSDSSVEKAKESVQDSSKRVQIEEIIVTAQKRNERQQDVPVPVTAISGAMLTEQNQLRIQDYSTSIPGLSATPRIQSSLILAIRGITTGPTNPTVGVTVDDVPYGSSTSNGGGAVVPDIDPGDLERVEVLRGPQGTLYGANSMGGLLKFVTVDPSTDALHGRVQLGTNTVRNGAELGYNVRGAVNVPVNDVLAIRASGFTRQDPGYIDNVLTGQRGVNETRVSGGRLSALWRPVETVSLKVSALYQKTEGDGSSDVDRPTSQPTPGYVLPPLGDLQQSYTRNSGAYDRQIQAYNATLTAKWGGVDFTSVSGYNVNQFADSFDASYQLGGATQAVYGAGGAPIFSSNKTGKFTQEVRASSSIGQHLDGLLGGFYTHENSTYEQNAFAVDPVSGAVVARALTLSFPSTYQEYAAFADLTYHFTDRFDVQVGGRESKIRQSSSQSETIPLAGITTPILSPEVDSDANAFTYLVTPRFKLSSDLMVYARLASGYRAGGPNLTPGGPIPRQFDPDKTRNYEIGVKGEFLDRALSVESSVYYIDWQKIQLSLVDQVGYFVNGSAARSEGVEFSVDSRPSALPGLEVSGWVVWNEAALTENLPPNGVVGLAGDRLPYSSRLSGNASVEQSFALTRSVTGFAGGTVSYVGDRKGVFTFTGPRQDLPAYANTDLRVGVRFDSCTLNLFATNVFDRRAVVAGGAGDSPPFAFTVLQPRTVGVSIAKVF